MVLMIGIQIDLQAVILITMVAMPDLQSDYYGIFVDSYLLGQCQSRRVQDGWIW
jgi:hypothetical protein